jgi:N-acyl-phosphatidylethanolamine-hydrolysing phospholipase D
MQNSHVGPQEALAIFRTLDPGMALAVHWGTFQLSFEGMDQPAQLLSELQRQQGLPQGRFVTTAPGQSFRAPAR